MSNPFEKRASEYLRDDEAFLALVTPTPLITFFQQPAQEDCLYDRLTVVIGTPGSGKTTLARLFQLTTLNALLRNQGSAQYKSLLDALGLCRAIVDEKPTVVGQRIPLEAEYRDFWEFPYPEDLRTGLMIALLQARTVLAWIRNIERAGHPAESIEFIPRSDAEASLVAMGGANARDVQKRAREVELAIYRVSAALLPPPAAEIEQQAVAAFRPFDVIESIRVGGEGGLTLRPLAIFDDAHILHPMQFAALRRSLARRDLRVSRWIMTRLDALSPNEVLGEVPSTDVEPGFNSSREITEIRMQAGESRSTHRKAFRKMAADMADRYLGQMDIFSRRALKSLADLLPDGDSEIPQGKLEQLGQRINAAQKRLGVSHERRETFTAEIDAYCKGSKTNSKDLPLAMLEIMMERFAKRVPQRELFDMISDEFEPSRPVVPDSQVAEGARIHLLHRYGRPYYHGLAALCDAGTENAEQFLQLAARLVAQSETQLIRAKAPALSSTLQNKLLREKTQEMLDSWDFPHHQSVRKLVTGIAKECVAKSLEPNAPLGGGANAFGIPQEEFESIPEKLPDLGRILKYAVAYNALILVPRYKTKNRLWCLVELGGISIVHHGLTLHRGGFLERGAIHLSQHAGL